jgi:hypothetical protein
MWAKVEEFLASRGFTEEAIARILEIAHAQGLDATLINRVLTVRETEEVKFLH